MSTSFLCLLRQTERWNLRVTFSSSLPWFSLQVRLLVQGFFFSAPPSHLYRTVPTVYGGTTTPFLKKIYKSLRDEDFAKYFLFTKTKKDICSFHFLIHRAIILLETKPIFLVLPEVFVFRQIVSTQFYCFCILEYEDFMDKILVLTTVLMKYLAVF